MAINPAKIAINTRLASTAGNMDHVAGPAANQGAQKDTLTFSGNQAASKASQSILSKIKSYISRLWGWFKGLFPGTEKKTSPTTGSSTSAGTSTANESTSSKNVTTPPTGLEMLIPETLRDVPHTHSGRSRFSSAELQKNPEMRRRSKLDQIISDISPTFRKPGDTISGIPSLSFVPHDARSPEEIMSGKLIRIFETEEDMQKAEHDAKDLKFLLGKYQWDVANLEKLGKDKYEKAHDSYFRVYHEEAKSFLSPEELANESPVPYELALKWAKKKVQCTKDVLAARKKEYLDTLDAAEEMQKKPKLKRTSWAPNDKDKALKYINKLYC